MRIYKMLFMTLLVAVFMAGCGNNNGGGPANTTTPIVSSTNPVDAAISVPTNQKITAIFNEPMAPATLASPATSFTVACTLPCVSPPGTVTYVGTTASFAPTSALAASTQYTATITTGAKSLAGNALAVNKLWTFTTGLGTDTTAPTVISTNPANGGAGVATNATITATFSKAVDPATITGTTFTLKATVAGTSVSGTVTSVGSVATFTPTSNLAASTGYTATITTGVKDLAGNALAAAFPWSFTTGTATAKGPAPVLLGTTDIFAILTKAGITDSLTTSVITGDVGTSPITGAAITGLSCTEVALTYTIFDDDAAYTGGFDSNTSCLLTNATLLTTAVSDMELAYTDAAGRSNPDFTELGAGNIDGLELAPGLYKWSTGVVIPVGVTLAGGANDVWIFQIAGNLTVANAAIVTLSGGAQAKNIFWQVAGQATLGTTAQFEGTILSQTAISLGTGAVVNGRLLAQTAVTLEGNTVTKQ